MAEAGGDFGAGDAGAAAAVELPLGALMVDLSGEELTAAEADFLRHPAVGAVLLFARNYKNKAQLIELTRSIKSLRAPALLVAVDQEGGSVQRFGAGFHALPAPARLGEIYDRDRDAGLQSAQEAGRLMAAEVAQVGVDFSFAPVLDLANPQSAVIGARAFHRDPAAVAALAGAFISGMRRAGMAATVKHFPGHAGVDADSHRALPVDARAFADIENRDLAPFAALAARAGGVMTAHIQFPRVDARAPAYSSVWLRDILRRQLGFDGAIFSDDLSMAGAAIADADTPARCAAALKAGCDMALVCNDPTGARQAAAALANAAPPAQSRLNAMRRDASARIAADEVEKLAMALAELSE